MGLPFRRHIGIHYGREGTDPEWEACPAFRRLADHTSSAHRMLAF